MRGLVLAGGGVRGAYQMGAYLAFKKKGIRFDGIVGASIGSFNAAMLAAKKDKELLDLWENVEVSKILGLDEELAKLIKLRKINFKLIKGIAGIISAGGLKTSGMREILGELLDEKELRESNIDFGLVTLRVQSLKPVEIFKKDIPEGKIKDYIIASCYLPLFKPEKMIDEANYFDGGIYNRCPVSMLVEKGYDEIYVVTFKGIGLSKRLKKHNSKIIYVEASKNLGPVLTLDQNLRKRNIKLGYYDTLKVLNQYHGYEYIFKKRSNIFYNFITRNISKREMRRLNNFFNSFDNKETVLRAIEYYLKKENLDEFKIYKPYKEIKRIKNEIKDKTSFIYKFINNLKYF